MIDVRAALRPAVRRARRLIPRRRGPAILMYHRIADESFDPWGMAVRPDNFADQAQWLAKHRQVLPLAEFAAAQRTGKLPRDAAAITFDDGYACTFMTAEPVLKNLDLPATVFVPSASLQRGGEYWWDELERLVLGSSGDLFRLDDQEIDLGPSEDRDRQWRPYQSPRTPRQKAFRKLWSIIHPRRADDVERAMADLRRQTGQTPSPRNSHRIATVDEVRSSMMDFGCHGLTHASIPKLSSPEQVREIEEGKALLARLTGRSPTAFAFPFGDFDRDVTAIIEKAGFLCACTSRQAVVRRHSDVFALPRLVAENTHAAGLAWTLGHR